MMSTTEEKLVRLWELTSGYNLFICGQTVKLSVSYHVRPDPGLTHDGYENKFFSSNKGISKDNTLDGILDRAIEWVNNNKGRRIK